MGGELPLPDSGTSGAKNPPPSPPPAATESVFISSLPRNESHHRGSVHDRLAPPIEDGQAKELVVFRQPVPSTQRRSGSDRAQSQSRVSSASCTSTYTTGSYEHSHSTESHETVALEDEDYQGTTDPPWRGISVYAVINGLKRVDTVKDAAQESFLTRTPKKKIEKGTKRAMILYKFRR
ncbi:hypothetical protein RHSIM_Rhsim12G0212800 [Rhododendron simsii]|uniref:Uncharacterized protein n=1 Tax=Rhododendron simsii TaxID=118357 RepID=A0A834G5M5_RHOSS|nr:hypothetical protein RHSIM_Rhsim12G0212800 [Rhododendron simsii]